MSPVRGMLCGANVRVPEASPTTSLMQMRRWRLGGAALLLGVALLLSGCIPSTGVSVRSGRQLLEDPISLPSDMNVTGLPLDLEHILNDPNIIPDTAAKRTKWILAERAALEAQIRDAETEIMPNITDFDGRPLIQEAQNASDRARAIWEMKETRAEQAAEAAAKVARDKAEYQSEFPDHFHGHVVGEDMNTLGFLGKIPSVQDAPFARGQHPPSAAHTMRPATPLTASSPMRLAWSKAEGGHQRSARPGPAKHKASKLGDGISTLLEALMGAVGGGTSAHAAAAPVLLAETAELTGMSGKGLTGGDDDSVWHYAKPEYDVWHREVPPPVPTPPPASSSDPSSYQFNPSLFPPGYKKAFDSKEADRLVAGAPGPPGGEPDPAETAAAASGAAAAANVWVSAPPPGNKGGFGSTSQQLPPGSGARGPPSGGADGGSGAGLATAIGQSEASDKACDIRAVKLCQDSCKSKMNLDMGDLPIEKCMPKCLGDCAPEFGFVAGTGAEEAKASEAVKMIEKQDANLIAQVEDAVKAGEVKEKSAGLSAEQKQAADSIAAGAVAHLEGRKQAETHAQLVPQAAGAVSSHGGARPLPMDVVSAGTPTGVYDCRGQAILVGSVVGRMVGGQPCEDRFLLVTAGKWLVTSFGEAGMSHGKGFTDDRTAKAGSGATIIDVVLRGITADVNMGTRLDFEPVQGAFTDWKLIQGGLTNDLFLPANVNRMIQGGIANKAMTHNGLQASAMLLSHAHSDLGGDGAGHDKVQAAVKKDWDNTHNTEAGLQKMSSGTWRWYTANPLLKYSLVGIALVGIGAWQLVSRGVTIDQIKASLRARASSESARQSYVTLPDAFGGRRGGRVGSGDQEMQVQGPRGGGGSGVIMVENASDRVVIVDIGGGQSRYQ